MTGVIRHVVICAGLVLLGCATPSRRMGLDTDLVLDTDLRSEDLRTAAQIIARSLRASAVRTNDTMRIAFVRMENRTLDDQFDSFNLLDHIRALLLQESDNAFSFVDQRTLRRLLAKQSWDSLTPEEQRHICAALNVEYFLTGRAYAYSKRRAGERDVYYRLSFRLTDARSSKIVWSDAYECNHYGKYEPINR